MGYSSAFRTATQLTGQARAAADTLEATFKLSPWFPSVENFTLDYNFDVNSLALTDTATYRTFDTESQYGSVQGGQSRNGKLPPISRKLRVNEYDQLSLYGQADGIGAKFDDYSQRLGAMIEARVALAQGNAAEFGSITINENKLTFTVDFGRKGTHTVTAGTVWSNPAAPALSDLTTYLGVYVATNNAAPAVAMMSTQVLAALQKNTSIISAATGQSTANSPTIVSQDQVRSVFAAYGFGRIVVNDDQVNVEGVATRIISANKLVFLPEPPASPALARLTGGFGSTEWGIPAESINPVYGIADADKPGIFSAAFHDEDPEGHNVLGSAIVLPVERNANASFTAAVI